MASATNVKCLTHKHKPPKRHRGAEGGEVSLSNLPESLLSHILSDLPTKDAVRTSVLSKRWMQHWTSITNLDLNDTVFYSSKKKSGGKLHFVNFVYRALLLTKSSSINSFSLVIGNKYDVSLINTWISSVLKTRNLKKLCIHSQTMQIPFSSLTSNTLFNSDSLEEMVLKMDSCASITVPTSNVNLGGQLKFLKLSGITFSLDGYSQNLSFSFPLLQNFETKNCIWYGAKRMNVTFEAPNLKRVVIVHHGVELSPNGQNMCRIMLSNVHLSEFSYHGHGRMSLNISLLQTSSLHNASADLNLYGGESAYSLSLLQRFSQVKYLKLFGSQYLDKRAAALPEFGMLSHLELGYVFGEDLLGLLQKSPVLNTLMIRELVLDSFNKVIWESAVVPNCLKCTLQVVKFGMVCGHEHELYLAKFMMENASELKRISFSFVDPITKSEAIEQFKERLFSFKKGLGLAIVEFSYV